MWIVVGVLLVVVLYPQLWMILGSFKTQTEFFENPTWALPETLNLDNYVAAFTRGNVALNYRNSLLVTIPSVFFILLLGVAAGYVLEVMIWKGRRTVLLFILAGIMVPGQMILVPLFTAYFRVGHHQHAVADDPDLHGDGPPAHDVPHGGVLPLGPARDLRGGDRRRLRPAALVLRDRACR